MYKDMYDTLDKFFANKTVVDVDRNTFLVCNLTDNVNKYKFSFVFLRDWDSLESDEYNVVILANRGAVFTFPPYWVAIPKELAIPYFEYIIDNFYEEYASKWPSYIGGGEQGEELPCNPTPSDNNDCQCPCGNV